MYQRDYRTATNSPTGTFADSDVFTFDKASRMLTAISGRYGNTVTYMYDPVGRKASEGLTIGGQTYSLRERGDFRKVSRRASAALRLSRSLLRSGGPAQSLPWLITHGI